MIVPVEAPHVRAEIETIFRRLLNDNSQAWTLAADGTWARVQPEPSERRRASQLVAMRGRDARPPARDAGRLRAADMWRRIMEAVPVGVIDVGSNTVRLHVARGRRRSSTARRRCSGSASRSSAPAAIPSRQARGDRRHRQPLRRRSPAATAPSGLEVLVDEPGPPGRERRRAARPARRPRPASRSGCSRPRRRAGSPSSARSPRPAAASAPLIAVCDVGGGSAQVAVGTRRDGVAWVRSIDIGSMRLTSRLLGDDPPGDAADRAGARRGRPPARRLRAARARARARRRRQRTGAPLDRRAGARRRRARRGRRDPRPHARRRDLRALRRPRPTGCGRSRPAPSSSRRCSDRLHVPLRVVRGGGSARAPCSSSPPGAKPPRRPRPRAFDCVRRAAVEIVLAAAACASSSTMLPAIDELRDSSLERAPRDRALGDDRRPGGRRSRS